MTCLGKNETSFENYERWENWKSKWELAKSGDKIKGDVTKEGFVKKGTGKVEKQKECRTCQLPTFPQLTLSPMVKQYEI